jgi:hypothetical protein
VTTIQGFAYINGDVSSDISPKGSKKPIFERIRHSALSVSPELFINAHHVGAISAFAFAKDGSLKASWSTNGLKFSADLPDTRAGHDVRNALRAGLRLGVSIEFADAKRETGADGVQEIVAGTLMGISLTRPGMAYYSKPAVWLADAAPDTLPKDVQALRNKWLSDSRPATVWSGGRSAAKQQSAAEEADRFAHWFNVIKEQGFTLARLAAEGFRDDVIEQARAAGLK